MKIFVANSAYSDLETINEYYEAEGVPQVGKDFLEAILKHIETLADNPNIGRVVPEFGEERIRELIHSPFRIVYLREQDSIHVIRVWRSERLLKLPENKTE
ncbi:MAG: type II toxin-antitoxin system RelE/ParE family toxin [Gammaproteobacteria bacterium]|nr:MAG: type II toxin-antitoxin system RelE/ParE family toxin [Gammaproteobacteria bacterium]RLA40647.1 MAG: type II toxin-antitoxin system RelE/ParE family toxin [Gammaproteobacteria bacterium]